MMTKTESLYSSDELHYRGPQRTFEGGSLSEVAFPIGGIGTGTISLGGRGDLRDVEIRNHPDKGNRLPFTFFALWAQKAGQAPVAKILEGKIPPPFRDPFGEFPHLLTGVGRFAEATFQGEYPVGRLTLRDPQMPVRATLSAWNPFIPLNVHDSALPVAIFEWTFHNESDEPVEISLASSLSNPLGVPDINVAPGAGGLNSGHQTDALRGIRYTHPQADPTAATTGTLALCSPWADMDVVPCWYRGGWWDKGHLFWDAFAATGKLPASLPESPATDRGDVGSLVLHATVPAYGSVTLPVYLSWHFPRMENLWRLGDEARPAIVETYAGAHFDDAWAVAEYVQDSLERLRGETNDWREAMFGSSLPDHVIEAATSQASIMRTNTCFLLADGRFYGWEGNCPKVGSCHGNCTHVWNYEQAVAFLFPELERTMRQTEFLHNTNDAGHMHFRTALPPEGKVDRWKPCADGQMGTIIQVYRDWQLSGDGEFLKEIWPKVQLALEYAWTMTPEKMAYKDSFLIGSRVEVNIPVDSLWDPDKDGLMEGEQHNTYDIEFFGPNTMCTAMYLGALRAGEEIARHLGDNEKAEEYRTIYESGRAKVDSQLWNGEYYIQKIGVIPQVTVKEVLRSPALEDGSEASPKYQYGKGCLSDQLVGQWAAHVAGLGYVLDPEHVRSAVRAVFEHNFRARIGEMDNVQRVYAMGDEPGLLLCSWPEGNRPALPFVYSDEVWTGIEYQVAAHLIYEGWVDEGLTIVKAVSERYAGYNRNPWNQIEFGNHYARAMASWSVKLALDGFRYNATQGLLGFAPKINRENYNTFWSTGTGWGSYHQQLDGGQFTLRVIGGIQKLQRLELADLPDGNSVVVGPGGTLSTTREGNTLVLSESIILKAGESLIIAV